MQSEKENTSEEKSKKKSFGFKNRKGLIACAAILAGGALTAGIVSNQRRAKLEFSRFHISSNYLEEDEGVSYTVSSWGNGFDILLYNYEKEDISQISEVDMAYKVTADHAAVTVKKQSGDAVATTADGLYTFEREVTTAYHVLHVTPDADTGQDNAVAVTVETTSPYQKTLKAEFRVQNYRKPDYTVTDQNDGTILITVNTNDYQDNMTVIWEPDKYSPDNTNELMDYWTDETHVGHFPVNSNSTYELLFYKKTDAPYTEQKGTATEITLE